MSTEPDTTEESPQSPPISDDAVSLVEEGSLAEEASSDPSDSDPTPSDIFEPEDDIVDEPTASSAEDEEYLEAPEKDADSYLDDDEEWAAASDEILHHDEDSVIAQQEEAVVSWDIRGLYDEQGKVRSKRSLKNNPPLLVISNSNGENASFVLTKNLSGLLARHFDNTYRAYYGIRPKEEMSLKEKLNDAKSGLRENMGKAIIIGGLLVALLIFGFFF